VSRTETLATSLPARLRPTPAPPPDVTPSPEAAPDPLQHARAHAERGDPTTAPRPHDAHLPASPFQRAAYVLRAWLPTQQGRPRRALEDASRALLLERTNVHAHLVRVAALLALGEHDEARRALRRTRRQLDAVHVDEATRGELEATWSSLATVAGRTAPG